MKSLHLVAPALLFGLAAFGAAAATGVFVEGAALAPFTAPTELELGRDRDAPFRALQGQHFVQPGRSTVVVIRLDVQDTGTRGMAMENGRVDRLTLAVPPVVASFESGLGDPRLDVRFTSASSAFGSASPIAVRRRAM